MTAKTKAKQDTPKDSKMDFNPDGTITVLDDGTKYTLRVPRFGQYKAVKVEVFSTQARIREKSQAMMTELKVAKEATENQEAVAAEAVQRSEQLVDDTMEELTNVMRFIFNELSDTPLPINSDEWPAWLVGDQMPMTQMLRHWKTVPLGRGSQ